MNALMEELESEFARCKKEINTVRKELARLEERKKCFQDREAMLFHLIEIAKQEAIDDAQSKIKQDVQ